MLASSSSLALGQNIPGATRPINLEAGVTFVYGNPDYTPQHDVGYGIFGLADVTPHWGAELNYHSASIQKNSPAKETTFEYGIRYHRDYGRYSPFLRASGGRGTFHFAPNFYQHGASPSYNIAVFGGGVDIALTSRIGIRASGEYQHWFTSDVSGTEVINNVPVQAVYLPHGLTPLLFEVGVSYHFFGGNKISGFSGR
jgi:hypothetical protein